MRINVQTVVSAPIAEVWSAYSNPDDIVKWNAASDDWHTPSSRVDLRPGGEFSNRMEAKDGSEGFDFTGTYTRVVENELIEYSFGDRTALVEFSQQPSGVLISVTFDAEDSYPPEAQLEGWQAILESFKRHVEAKRG